MEPNHPHESFEQQATIEKLGECFRHELSAVETYELALQGVTHVGLHHALQELLVSHSRRTDQLRERIGLQGGQPPSSSGVWGAFAKAVQRGADLLGDRAAIGALEQGEDRALAFYAEGLEGCDPSTRTLIGRDLLPEQRRTHDLCRTLKSFVNAPS
jgi:hypothetical protein